MKLAFVFLLLVLAEVAMAQLLPSTWRIVGDHKDQNIWNQLGLK